MTRRGFLKTLIATALVASVSVDDVFAISEPKKVIDLSKWNNIVVTVNNGIQTIFVNGDKIADVSAKLYIDVVDDAISITSFSSEMEKKLNGSLTKSIWMKEGKFDSIRIFNRAITYAEVGMIYKEHK